MIHEKAEALRMHWQIYNSQCEHIQSCKPLFLSKDLGAKS